MTAAKDLALKQGIAPACEALGLSRATFYRSRRPQGHKSRIALRPKHPSRLRCRRTPGRAGCPPSTASWIRPLERSMPRFWTKALICAQPAPCTASGTGKVRCGSDAGSYAILSNGSRNCWRRTAIRMDGELPGQDAMTSVGPF